MDTQETTLLKAHTGKDFEVGRGVVEGFEVRLGGRALLRGLLRGLGLLGGSGGRLSFLADHPLLPLPLLLLRRRLLRKVMERVLILMFRLAWRRTKKDHDNQMPHF